jgi:hypothetical protein
VQINATTQMRVVYSGKVREKFKKQTFLVYLVKIVCQKVLSSLRHCQCPWSPIYKRLVGRASSTNLHVNEINNLESNLRA